MLRMNRLMMSLTGRLLYGFLVKITKKFSFTFQMVKQLLMEKILKFILFSIFLLLFSTQSLGQLNLKPGIAIGVYPSKMDKISEVDLHFEGAYATGKYFSIGLYASAGKIFSDNDKHHVLATGLSFEFRGFFNEKMKIIPLINLNFGYNWESIYDRYNYGLHDQFLSIRNETITGLNLSGRIGVLSNFENTGPYQFQIDTGITQYSFDPSINIFGDQGYYFFQTRFTLVYRF